MTVVDNELNLVKCDSKKKKKEKKEELRTHRETPGCACIEGWPREEGARGRPSASQGESLRWNQPHQHLDLGLPASRTERKYIYVVKANNQNKIGLYYRPYFKIQNEIGSLKTNLIIYPRQKQLALASRQRLQPMPPRDKLLKEAQQHQGQASWRWGQGGNGDPHHRSWLTAGSESGSRELEVAIPFLKSLSSRRGQGCCRLVLRQALAVQTPRG